MSMRSTRSDLKSSRFPMKLGLHPAPPWKRRAAAAGFGTRPGGSPWLGEGVPPTPGDRIRRSEQVDTDASKLGEMAHLTSDDT